MRLFCLLLFAAAVECSPPTTASPTSAPTGTPGRCCGKNSVTGENFCLITDVEECEGEGRRGLSDSFVDTLNRRVGSLGGNWTVNQKCNVANPCDTGVPVSAGGATFTLDVANAGLGNNNGVSLTPTTEENLPAGSAAKLPGAVLLAFEVLRYDGSNALPSDFLPAGKYITVKIQTTDPELVDPKAVQLLRWDDVAEEWKDIQVECQGKIASTDFLLDVNTNPNTLSGFLCHTSQFVMTANADAEDKPDKKKKRSKKPTKVATVAKPGKLDPKAHTKVATVGKVAKKDAKPAEGKKESAKGGKKIVGIAVGAGIGAAVVSSGAAIAICKYRNNRKPRKAHKKPKARDNAVTSPFSVAV